MVWKQNEIGEKYMKFKNIMLTNHRFNINKHWGKFCCTLDEYNDKSCFYWFDKNTYKIIGSYSHLTNEKKKEIDNDNDGRYVVLPQYVSNSRYKELIKELKSLEVTEFFEQATDEENAHYKYRCFIDWNGLEHSEWYKTHLIVREIIMKWCDNNQIRYVYKSVEPPPNYIYDGRTLSDANWCINGY